MKQKTKGFVYVATGDKFLAEAEASVKSLRLSNADARVCLITDNSYNSVQFDEIIITNENSLHPYQFKLNMVMAPFDYCIFLDSDTEILGDVSELFALLHEFDVAISKDYFTKGVADYVSDIGNSVLPEWNTGVIAFRKSPEICKFFRTCAGNYEKLHSKEGFLREQRAFLQTLYYSRLRIVEFPNTYNFMPYEATMIPSEVKILHGRRKDFAAGFLSPTLLQSDSPRVYIPHFGVIPNRGRYVSGLKRQVYFSTCAARFLFAGFRWFIQQDLRIMIGDTVSLLRVKLGALRKGLLSPRK